MRKTWFWEVEMQVHFRETTLGRGSLDYAAYLRGLAALPHDAPLMIEHMTSPEEYEKSRQHLLKLAGELGLSFGSATGIFHMAGCGEME